MNMPIADIYGYYINGVVVLQGASQAAIDLLKAHYPLQNGTTALLPPEASSAAYALIDAAGLQTMTF